MSGQKIVLAFIEIGMFVNLEIGRIAKDHIHLNYKEYSEGDFLNHRE